MGSIHILNIIIFIFVMLYAFKKLHKKRENEKQQQDYLQGRRSQLLVNCLPECSYFIEWNLNGIGNIAKKYVIGNYYKYLGCLQYQEASNGIYLHDIISRVEFEESPDEYYENLIYEYSIPTDSPVYGLGCMEVKQRTSDKNSIMNHIVKSSMKTVMNLFGVAANEKNVL